MPKSKLLKALDAHKGRDYKLEKQRKQQKEATKRKKSKTPAPNAEEEKENVEAPVNGNVPPLDAESEGWESNESEAEEENSVYRASSISSPISKPQIQIDLSRLLDDESDSDSSLDDPDPPAQIQDEGEDDEEDIPLSDIDSLASSQKADLLPHQRLTINNTSALRSAHRRIVLPPCPFSTNQTLTTTTPVSIPDVNDDLTRELAFYKQCLDAAVEGRERLRKEGVPFSRPNDYFAEMVKSDEHMGKVKGKMVEEAAGKRAAADARKQRDLKKFGKQVQVAKLQERDKAKRETLDKINLLKRSTLVYLS